MKKRHRIICQLMLWGICMLIGYAAHGQVYNAAYVSGLYKQYPTVKSNFCPACKLWVNPYFKSIADTSAHMPLITYELFTKANAANVSKLAIERTPKKGSTQSSIFGAWHSVYGQPNEDNVYSAANDSVKKYDKKDEIAKGHCQAWILNAFSYDSAIFSDTYTFNAACEDQGQNIGTEIATEDITRKDLLIGDVQVWCGTYGKRGQFTDDSLTDVYPDHYWKIIVFNGVTTCYWMLNDKTQDRSKLPGCLVTYTQLVSNLGFDPEKILN